MSYLMIFVTAIFVNNIILSQFLGICPFLGVSKKLSTAAGMGVAVMFVMTLATTVTFLIYYTFLQPYHLTFMTTVTFILVIAALVQMVEIVIKKTSPALYQSLGIFLPLITTNCAVLGIAILTIQKNYTLIAGICYTLASAMGFTLAIILFAGIRERLARADIPQAVRGTPIVLIAAALLSMAFMGFAGISY
ncbi:MAG: electron transport complex subunit RsxA [bacterium]|nr:electron transport complex subunit RsxA [bacterium]MDY2830040.1 electron transport complex subunit RsxA [Alphaproteobacteria bacterium]